MEIKLTNVARASLGELLIDYEDVAIQVNTMIFLIKKTIYILSQHLKQMEINFVENGGIRERMTSERKKYRGY